MNAATNMEILGGFIGILAVISVIIKLGFTYYICRSGQAYEAALQGKKSGSSQKSQDSGKDRIPVPPKLSRPYSGSRLQRCGKNDASFMPSGNTIESAMTQKPPCPGGRRQNGGLEP